ncbi:hypothetical protein SAMN02927937_02264 [Paenimyroides aquimaris]|uniref:Methyltransferase type 11 n=1 Tax=Paenimyroides marinum TaxID=1159016 RepID=A0A1H6M8W1_9FLAO|nr:hypothetical protein [Paenimyroides aquimaris]SEH93970.1 hypothetical protein SAMN02927937_02264 [Paenimyroides aquimaris]
MIKVFKTNVNHPTDSDYLLEKVLMEKYPGFKINFDLEDCDNILRMEGSDFSTNDVVVLLDSCGFLCEELE